MIASTGRADLLRALLEGGEEGLRSMAKVLGYEESPVLGPERAMVGPSPGRRAGGAGPTEPGPSATQGRATAFEPIRFWRMTQSEPSLDEAERIGLAEPTPERRVEPLTEGDLERDPEAVPPAVRPIAPWPRLWRWLDDRLRTTRPRRQLDVRRLVDLWARGLGVDRLPRLDGLVHCRVRVIVDRRRQLLPFHLDQLELVDRLEQRLGASSVRVVGWQTPQLESLGDDEQVLALGDLGILEDDARGLARRELWRGLAERLARRGITAQALVLCPSHRWPRQLARPWRAAEWADPTCLRQLRDPSTSEARANEPVELVLRLASLAVRLERGLVRDLVRLIPGAGLDTEARVWAHPAVTAKTPRGLALDTEASRCWLADFAREVPEALQRAAFEVLRIWHATTLPEVWAEEVARMLALGMPEEWIGPETVDWASELVAKVAASVEHDPGDDPWARDTEGFFDRQIERAPQTLWHHPRFRRPLARALAAQAQRKHAPEPPTGSLPEMLPPPVTQKELVPWTLRQTTEGLRFFHGTAKDSIGKDSTDKGSWLATVRAWGIEARVGDGMARDRRLVLGETGEPLPWSFERDLLRITTDFESITLDLWTPPPWASAAGRDPYGLWAAFEVAGVEQRMRWIPPGRFVMGSPEDEQGRDDDEGPQHEVVLSEGFWLAETPCIQALWQAVMGSNPSHFQSPRRPVEQVSWDNCQRFFDRLNFRYRDLELQLPSEAEWEHACRAGTDRATWLGELEILGENNAPGLHPVAWYGGNSGVEYEFHEAADSSGWPEKRFEHQRAGTREVGAKDPNPWGLYDILGNVYEWCEDSWNVGEKYPEGPRVDPLVTEGPDRVNRGGSWSSYARSVRAAYRIGNDPGDRYHYLGFRLSRGPRVGGAQGRESASAVSGATERGTSERARSRRSRSWVKRLAWAVNGGLDVYGRWVAIEVEGVVHRLRWIYPGTFQMGSPAAEEGRRAAEGPRHEVTLTQGFWLGETPCTQALWEAVMGENPSRFKSPNRPVEQVSWHECKEFLQQLARRVPGFVAHLPTEAQWEYACRAGTTAATWRGDLRIRGERDAPLLDDMAWYGGNSGVDFDLSSGVSSSGWKEKQYPHTKAGTREVGQKAANPWGLHDMLGNVVEWCEDAWDWETGYPGGSRVDPLGTGGSRRVRRGGSWSSLARFVRAAYRLGDDPGIRDDSLGFRLSRGPEEDWLAEPQAGSGEGPGAADRGTREKPAPGRSERGFGRGKKS